MSSRFEKSVYAVGLIALVNIVSQVVAFFYRVALVRFVGAEVMGLYQLVVPLYSVMMSLTATGLTVAVSRLTAEYSALGQESQTVKLVSRARRLFFIAFFIMASLTALFSDAISYYILGDTRTRLGLLIMLACVLFTGIENIYKNYFYGKKSIAQPAFSEMVEQLARTSAVLFLVWAFPGQSPERTVALIVLGLVICEIVSSSVLRIMYRVYCCDKILGRPTSRRSSSTSSRSINASDKTLNRAILDIAIPVSISAVALNLIGSANAIIIPQRLMASGMASGDALSQYGIVFGMVLPLIALPMACVGALTLVMSPRISESVARGECDMVTRHVLRSLRATTIIMLPLLTLLAIFGQPIVNMLFRNTITNTMMILLCICFLLTSYQTVTSSVLNAIGKQKRAAANVMAAGVLQLVITWYAVAQPHLRLLGVVIAMLCGAVVALTLNGLDVVKGLSSRA